MHWQRKAKIHVQHLPLSHSVHHESHMDWPGIEPGDPWWDSQYGTVRPILTDVKIKIKINVKIKFFLRLNTTPWRLLEEWKYEPTHSEPLHRMAINGQPIAGRFIPSQTDAVPTGQEAGWAPELDWALWRAIKLLQLPGVEPRFLGLPHLT